MVGIAGIWKKNRNSCVYVCVCGACAPASLPSSLEKAFQLFLYLVKDMP